MFPLCGLMFGLSSFWGPHAYRHWLQVQAYAGIIYAVRHLRTSHESESAQRQRPWLTATGIPLNPAPVSSTEGQALSRGGERGKEAAPATCLWSLTKWVRVSRIAGMVNKRLDWLTPPRCPGSGSGASTEGVLAKVDVQGRSGFSVMPFLCAVVID